MGPERMSAQVPGHHVINIGTRAIGKNHLFLQRSRSDIDRR